MRLSLFFLLVLCLASCSRLNKLSEEDRSWMPYKGNEILVFKSNTGDTDTIFLLQKSTVLAYPEPQTLNGIKYEILTVSCRQGTFFEIRKARDGLAELHFLLSAKDAVFYRLSRIKTDSLNKVSPASIETPYERHNDVYVIEGEDYLGMFKERSNYITKLYWSRSKGLIRYDKKNNVYWELKESI